MPGKALLVAALMVSVALAQPFVNAPLLPLYNFVDGNNNGAVVGVVVAWGYAFTANSMGVYAMNTSAPTGMMPPFWDALPGVTQMWAYGNRSNMSSMGVIAIAGSTVALYKMNMTAVWREATLWTKAATFNLQTDSSSYRPSNQYPAMVPNPMGGWMFVLGTRNTSSLVTWVSLPSTVYAVNPVDLSIVWMTQVNSDSTNFAPSFCSEFVWVLTQNRTFGYTMIQVRKLYLTNGTMTSWSVDTGYSSLTYFNVQYDQFMVLNVGGFYDLYWLNGSHILYMSIPTCGTMPYAPVVINGTWYAICGSTIYMYNNMTFSYSMFSANSNIRCRAIHEYNHDFVLSGHDVVYVGNSSGIFTLATLPAPATSSSYSYCTGAMFNYWSPRSRAPEMLLDILHLSFIGSSGGSGGSVLTMDYRTGEVHSQAAGDLSPFGAAIVDFRDHRLFVASSFEGGDILQGYDFVNLHNTTSFLVDMSSTSSKYFSIAYNATNRSTYYVSSNAVYSIDWMGNSQQVGVVSLYTSNVAPVMIGQFLVVFDSYYGNAYVYDSVAKTMTTVSTCDLDEHVAPVVSNMMLILFCTSSSTAANVVDVSTATPTVKEISASNYRQASGAIVLGTTLIITTGESTVEGFDMTTAMSTPTWALSLGGLVLVMSPIVEYINNGYFVACPQTPNSSATYVYRVSSAGTLTQVGELAMHTDTSFKRLIIKSGGVFGGTVMYVIGSTNITAYTTAWTMMFNYKSTSGSIQTMYQNNPVVLDSGAVCFYTSNGWFNVIGGFEGALAWRYPSQTGLYYPVLTDNTSIFFTNGQSVIGANVYTGTIASVSTYLDGSTRGFAIAAGVNGTTVIGATDDEIIFANQVNRYQSAVTNFPSSGSAPKGNNNTFGDDDEKSKAWIAGAVVGGIVVIAVVVFVLRRAYVKSPANHYPQAVHQRGQVQHGSLKTVGPGTAYGTSYGTAYGTIY